MNRIVLVGSGLVAAWALVGCGGSTDEGGSTVTGAGGSMAGTGGSGFNPIGNGGGGASAGTGGHGGAAAGSGGAFAQGGSGASTSSAGAAGLGGSGVGGAGGTKGTPGYPNGPVTTCFGSGCPKGECDNEMFFADTTCSSLFTMDAGPDFPYCNAGENAGYCLEAGTTFVSPDYAVNCANGKATVLECASGCGTFGISSMATCDF